MMSAIYTGLPQGRIRMKKGVIATLVAAAVIGGGAYYALQHKGASQASSLSYVPADTLVFAGGLEPMSWSQLAAFRDSFAFSGSPESTRKVIEEFYLSNHRSLQTLGC
jgi:hypothetical protein